MDDTTQTLTGQLARVAREAAGEVCILHREGDAVREYTYGQLYRGSLAVARWLQTQGVVRGDRVAILLENRPQWPLSYFGILLAGAVAVPLDPVSLWDHIRYALEQTQAQVIFTFPQAPLDQLQQVRRMGSLGQLLGMLPGAASALGSADVSDEALSRAEALIRSMTPGERRSPKLIDGSRRRRIAAGAGTSPQQVNELLRHFGESQRMMKAFAEGRSPIPGLALPGRRMKKKR